MLHLFFRRIEVEGRENVPAVGPVLLVPNHANSLVDPLFLLTALRRPVTLTAKNVLGKNPLLYFLLRGLGAITFHRREDVGKGADPRQNVRSLRRCREVLIEGGALCIFPEGISHSDPKMRPFHTGAARIALDFVTSDGNPGGLQIIPVGLLYTEKDQFRSGIWVRFGTPIDAARWYADRPDGNAKALTDEIETRVAALTVNYETRRESLILTWATEIVTTRGRMPPPLNRPDPSVAEWFQAVARMREGYRTLLEGHRTELEDLTGHIRRYRAELKRCGIEPAEVYLPLHGGRAALFLVRELELLVVGAPMALFGAFNHLIPYLLIKRIARAMSKDKDHWATNVIYPSFLVFPFFYIVQLTVAWLLLPALWAGVYSAALPYTGYYALLYRDRAFSVFRRTRTFIRFVFRREEQERLAREGREIVDQIWRLDEKLRTRPEPLAKGEAS